MKIVLLGYMASGKSSIGMKLANMLNVSFVDLDDLISEKEKLSIPAIFKTKGEIYFRKKEIDYLNEFLLQKDNFILAVGGGTPCYGNNMSIINNHSKSIYLKSSIQSIINGLRAYIPVKTIGTTTYGKNVGSITLYDSPSSDYRNKSTANRSHKNAMQPITFQIYDKFGESDYTNGFDPDIEVKESQFWNNILPFGDENEVVLKAALDDIRGVSAKSLPSSRYKNMKELEVLSLEKRFDKEMYIEHDFFENNQ